MKGIRPSLSTTIEDCMVGVRLVLLHAILSCECATLCYANNIVDTKDKIICGVNLLHVLLSCECATLCCADNIIDTKDKIICGVNLEQHEI